MSSKSELAKLAQDRIAGLDSAIKAEKNYLETLESLIQFAKETRVKARAALEGAKTVVNNNIEREKLCPSLKEDMRWKAIVLEAQKNREEKLQNYNGWEKNYTEVKAKYEEHSDKLREYEDERHEMMIRLSLHLALNAEAVELKPASDEELAAEKKSFFQAQISLPRPK